MSKYNVTKAFGVTTFPNLMLLKPLSLQHSSPTQLILHLTVDNSKDNVVKTIGFAKWQKHLLLHFTVDMFENNFAKTNDVSNIMTT